MNIRRFSFILIAVTTLVLGLGGTAYARQLEVCERCIPVTTCSTTTTTLVRRTTSTVAPTTTIPTPTSIVTIPVPVPTIVEVPTRVIVNQTNEAAPPVDQHITVIAPPAPAPVTPTVVVPTQVIRATPLFTG